MADYIIYSFYTTTFGGSAITSTEFPSAVVKADALIDYLTMDRAAAYMALVAPTTEETAIINKIKLAVCAVMEANKKFTGLGGVVASESVGAHSVSYANADKQTYGSKMSEAAAPFLAHTGLMFRGFYDGEYGIMAGGTD